jgi:hypothetical protein
MSSARVTSQRWNMIAPSAWATSAAPPSSSMSPTITVAPSAARRSAVARPIPDAPPVTTARLPVNRLMSAMSLSRFAEHSMGVGAVNAGAFEDAVCRGVAARASAF